uniref:Ig-like domain-containing protein n=1 Tax=Cacopsylla melanoneura TaxID=428564 RepID=A0A8D8M3Z7_9HEMI
MLCKSFDHIGITSMAEHGINNLQGSYLVTLIGLLFYIQGIQTLKILEFEVPATVNISQKLVELRCTFDMEGRNLFAVKWYKDDAEFYRYMPKMDPKKQHFNTTGISLDMALSDDNSVYLNRLQYSTSGQYRCEISTDGPDYHSKVLTKKLSVMALPPIGSPRIVVNKHVIAAGDNLEANCTIVSNPAATLIWYINGEKAESYLLNREERQLPDRERRQFRSLALKFNVAKSHFYDPAHFDKINITCQATIPNLDEVLTNAEMVNNLHKSPGYVAAQGSHYSGAMSTAFSGFWVRVLLMSTWSIVVISPMSFY